MFIMHRGVFKDEFIDLFIKTIYVQKTFQESCEYFSDKKSPYINYFIYFFVAELIKTRIKLIKKNLWLTMFIILKLESNLSFSYLCFMSLNIFTKTFKLNNKSKGIYFN